MYTLVCKECQKTFTKHHKTIFCSNKCSQRNRWKQKNPIMIALKDFKNSEISEIPEDTLKSLHFIDLYEISNTLKRHDYLELLEKYRNFRKTVKLCKNCNNFYESTQRSGSKCPNPECFEYNHNRWNEGILKNKQTKLEKYGSENYNNYEKCSKTHYEKYGVKSPLQNPVSFEKWKQTNLKIYGCNTPTKSQKVKEKTKRTNLEKYGVEHPMKLETTKDKIKYTMIQKYGVTSCNYKDFKNLENFNEQYISQNFIENGFLQESKAIDYFGTKSINPVISQLKNTTFKREPRGTRLQKQVFYEFLKINDVNIQYEKQIQNYRVDGFIEPNIIIEILGDFWHGNPDIFKQDELNTKTNTTFGQLFNETIERFENLKKQGYKIQYIWETEFHKYGLKAFKTYG